MAFRYEYYDRIFDDFGDIIKGIPEIKISSPQNDLENLRIKGRIPLKEHRIHGETGIVFFERYANGELAKFNYS